MKRQTSWSWNSAQAPSAHLPLPMFSQKPTRHLTTLFAQGHHTVVEQVSRGLIGTSHFRGHFCVIACWQVVQNGAGVSGGAQPQVHVHFRLHWPTSRTFSRKLWKGHKEDHLVSRSQLWPSLFEKQSPGDLGTHPGGVWRAVLRRSPYTTVRPDATMPGECPGLVGPKA